MRVYGNEVDVILKAYPAISRAKDLREIESTEEPIEIKVFRTFEEAEDYAEKFCADDIVIIETDRDNRVVEKFYKGEVKYPTWDSYEELPGWDDFNRGWPEGMGESFRRPRGRMLRENTDIYTLFVNGEDWDTYTDLDNAKEVADDIYGEFGKSVKVVDGNGKVVYRPRFKTESCRPRGRTLKEDVDWDEFDRFVKYKKYLPPMGEGDTMASQLATAVSTIVHRYYNDGDTVTKAWGYGASGNMRNLTRWIRKYIPELRVYASRLLNPREYDYEQTLYDIAAEMEMIIDNYADEPKTGSIYD